jgi:hypothetical protein
VAHVAARKQAHAFRRAILDQQVDILDRALAIFLAVDE